MSSEETQGSNPEIGMTEDSFESAEANSGSDPASMTTKAIIVITKNCIKIEGMVTDNSANGLDVIIPYVPSKVKFFK